MPPSKKERDAADQAAANEQSEWEDEDRWSQKEPIRKAAVSIVISSGRLLCVWNRRYATWSLPGGMIEDGESPEEAQRRELEEETGVRTTSARLVHEGPHGLPHKPGRASIVCLFVAEVIGTPRAMEEGSDLSWMSVEDFLTQSAFRDFYAPILPRIVSKT